MTGPRGGDQPTGSERAQLMYRLRTEEYLTLRQLGERFNIGPERVRQILKRHCHETGLPYPSRPKRPAR